MGMGCRSSPLCSAVCRWSSPSRNGRGRGSDRRTPHDDGTCAGGDCHSEAGGVGVYLEAIGTVTPIYTDSITAQVTGHITAVRYREGQFVHKGDPLIDLDARPYEAQLEQAQGTLEHDQQVLAEAQMDLERYKQAWARNGIPRQTLEDQEKVVLQHQGTVEYDQGSVHYYRVHIEYCHITSPINGRVGLPLLDPATLLLAH